MVRKRTLYGVTQAGWLLLVVGTGVVLYSGRAETVVPASQLPPLPVAVAVAAIALLAVFLAFARHSRRAWRDAGRTASLEPESISRWAAIGLGSRANLAGTVHGRPVGARTTTRHTGSAGEGGSNQATYTVVETDLERAAERGVAVTRQSGGAGDERTDVGRATVQNVDVDDAFVAIGGNAELAREIVGGSARDPLRELDAGTTLLVGNAVEAVLDAVPDLPEDSFLGNAADDALSAGFPDDPSAVAVQTEGVVLDGDRLERQVRAAVAAADAFEAAIGE